MPKTDHQQIPAAAARFVAGPFQFAEADDQADGVPVKMHLRGLEAINHWYWGKIAHDMAGLNIHKDKLPIDYIHDPQQILGYLDTFETKKGLDVAGRIFPKHDPRADEVYRKAGLGIPYEASMDWADAETTLEWIPDGVTTEVNGQKFDGPGYIAREWSLRGAAICPYGADKNTSTSFAADGRTVGIKIFSKGEIPEMPKPTKKGQATDAAGLEQRKLTTIAPAQDMEPTPASNPPAADPPAETPPADPPAPPAETPPAEPADAGQDAARKAEGQRFLQAYGDELGARYFARGLTFEAAGAQFLQHLRDENARLAAEAAEAGRQIKTLRDQLGEAEPVSSTPEPDPKKAAGQTEAKRLGSEALGALTAKYAAQSEN